MTSKTEVIKNHCKQLKLSALAAHIELAVAKAQKQKMTYLELIKTLLETEIYHRKEKDRIRRTKLAGLPLSCNLDLYDHSFHSGLDKQQIKQLRELSWLEQNFNIIVMGPSGTGKTYIAAGLCRDAVQNGYRAYFKNMEAIVHILKLKDITTKAAMEYKRMVKAHLLVIDDIMMFPITPPEAVSFFNLINELHDKAALIITTNKSPKEWTTLIGDEVLTTALLDRDLVSM